MNIHEYQAKEVLRKFNVPVPNGNIAFTPAEAVEASKEFLAEPGGVCVVKAQIHAGGRGKAGGVKLARSTEEVLEHAKSILGATLVTHQTGPEGKEVKKILIEEGCDIKKEFYLGIVVDRATERVAIMASPEGGMEIEVVAAKTPERIFTEYIDPATGLIPFQGRKLAFALGLEKPSINKFVKLITNLYTAFTASDCSLVEINPLVLKGDGDLIALDAKFGFDDSALFRHKDIEALRDLDEEDPGEVEASRYDLNYVSLDGHIGCMVNGAGLAMATMDIIKLYGGNPANFLDVGGGAQQEQVTAAFKILVNDPRVKGLFVNIFGGIMRCDIIAEGIVAAAKEVGLNVPLVVRLQGTNVDKGKEILAKSGIDIITADKMDDAARKAVEASR